MSTQTVSLDVVKKCCFVIAKAANVAPNPTSRNPSYLLSLQLSPALSTEHKSQHKKAKDTYTSSAQITTQHKISELSGALMLAVINFPRKQIGRTMSDCLTTGVQIASPDAGEKEKRESTVFVKPFLGGAAAAGGDAAAEKKQIEPGSKVGVLGEDGIVQTNPRDLTWDEFASVKILVGTVLALDPASKSPSSPDKLEPVSLEVDFGTSGSDGAVVGKKKALVYLRSGFISPEELVGRQILAATNVAMPPAEAAEGESKQQDGGATEPVVLILTVGGKTTVEPAKVVENGYKLC